MQKNVGSSTQCFGPQIFCLAPRRAYAKVNNFGVAIVLQLKFFLASSIARDLTLHIQWIGTIR